MISRVEVKNYRCLRYINVPLKNFHVLVGPNASGKTTFLDVIAFLGDIVESGPDQAVNKRASNFLDLVWMHQNEILEFAIEVNVPEEIVSKISHNFDTLRYEISIGYQDQELGIFDERVIFKKVTDELKNYNGNQVNAFPVTREHPGSILSQLRSKSTRTVINKKYKANDNFYSEVTSQAGKGWMPSFKLGPKKSALGNLPEDETRFPASTWLKNLLSAGIQNFVLNSQAIRKASAPGQGRTFKTDGSNLPWVIEDLKEKSRERFEDWILHIQTALPDIKNIKTVERADDKHRYLVVEYKDGIEVPSWMVSDGTLRLLALTLPAYISDFSGIYLIEEPENGIHPKAVETVIQSLSSVYNAQILMATHSPVVLSVVDISEVLCFAKTEMGDIDIIQGNNHPDLRDWRGDPNLGVMFAAGVLE